MSRWRSPDAGSLRGRVAMAQPSIWRNAGWWLLQALALAAVGYAVWQLIGRTPYRIDIDVYRMGGMLDPTGLFQIYSLPGFTHLRDPQFVPQPVADFTTTGSIFAAIRARDRASFPARQDASTIGTAATRKLGPPRLGS